MSSSCLSGARRLCSREAENSLLHGEDADVIAAALAATRKRSVMGGSHKSKSERILLAARGKIGSILAGRSVMGHARAELEEVTALLVAVELELGKARLSDPLRGLLDTETTSVSAGAAGRSEAAGAETNRWLIDTYTDVDRNAAEGNQALTSTAQVSTCAVRGSRHTVHRMSTHLLDAHVDRALASSEVQEQLQKSGTLDFDAFVFTSLPDVRKKPLCVLGLHLLRDRSILQDLDSAGQIGDREKFQRQILRFFGEIDGQYKPDAIYHSVAHGADVMMTMEWFLQMPYFQQQTSTLDHLMGVVAGAIHDVGHPGTNNLFHSNTMAPLAIQYNDRSILENMHVALSFQVMQQDETCNWFASLPRHFRHGDDPEAPVVNLQQYVRKGLISMILATDMAKHAKHVSKLKQFLEDELESRQDEQEGTPVATQSQGNKQNALERKLFLLETGLHASDVSNPCKPRLIMLGWTERVLEEFWAQGDEEQKLNLEVSPLCDRQSGQKSIPKGQIGFINFVIMPLFSPIVQLVPEVKAAVDMLQQNKAFWEEMDRKQATMEDIFGTRRE